MSDEEWAFFASFVIETGARRGRRPRNHRQVLEHSRRLATRYDKTADSYLGFILVASIRLWVRHFVNRT
jgi:hypothetical protein